MRQGIRWIPSPGVVLFAVTMICPGCAGEFGEDSGAGEADAGGQDVAPSGEDVLPPVDAVATAWTYNTCSVEVRVGGFEVTLADEYTGINGMVLEGVVPTQIPELIAEAGGCQLLKARNLFCEPACVPGETCGEDGACIVYPESLSVGVVTLTGMKSPQSMEAKWGNHYTNSGSLEHPGYEVASGIHLVADGGDQEGFSLEGRGVAALALPAGGAQVSVEAGEALGIQWTASSPHDGVRIHIDLNINNHGSSGAYITCEVEDTGSHFIDESLMTALQGFGVSGFPSLLLTRQSADSVSLGIGCVEFLVASERAVAIEVDGVTSCTSDAQCPPGKACSAQLQCE